MTQTFQWVTTQKLFQTVLIQPTRKRLINNKHCCCLQLVVRARLGPGYFIAMRISEQLVVRQLMPLIAEPC